MRILHWNIRHGAGTRIQLICEELLKYNADIIVLSEYRNNKNGEFIKSNLSLQSYNYQYYNVLDTKINTVAVFSKIKFEKLCVSSSKYSEKIMKLRCNKFTLYPMYFPQDKEKYYLFDYIIKEIDNNKENINLFIGDFNTGKNTVDKTENGTPFYCDEKIYEIENKDYLDIWRYINNDTREYSWYSKKNGYDLNGFRVDQAFINNSMKDKINDCFYLHKPRIEGKSDHSIMIVDLNI